MSPHSGPGRMQTSEISDEQLLRERRAVLNSWIPSWQETQYKQHNQQMTEGDWNAHMKHLSGSFTVSSWKNWSMQVKESILLEEKMCGMGQGTSDSCGCSNLQRRSTYLNFAHSITLFISPYLMQPWPFDCLFQVEMACYKVCTEAWLGHLEFLAVAGRCSPW